MHSSKTLSFPSQQILLLHSAADSSFVWFPNCHRSKIKGAPADLVSENPIEEQFAGMTNHENQFLSSACRSAKSTNSKSNLGRHNCTAVIPLVP